ncbi:MAG: hypothetical protein M4579_004095 [Chaenotheca gracillima]|nr:MAG: hypothetical protein M4579_004095 [Chaenotheca gracillima]
MVSNTPGLLYVPNLAGNIFFIAFFSIALAAQLFLSIKTKTWGFLAAIVGALLLEILGYIGRIGLHNNTDSHNGFLMYLISLTIAGAFYAASIYVTLAHIVVVFGEHISRVRPRTYTIVFMSCDFFSLLLQAIGGAIASSADTQKLSQLGVHIMIAGLSTQVFSLIVFIVLALEFAWRAYKADHFDPKAADLRRSLYFRSFIFALGLGTLTLFIRSVFRVAELSEGYDGALANDEITFMTLEGTMIAITTLCLTIFHPGVSFQGRWKDGDFSLRAKKNVTSADIQEQKRASGTSSPLDENVVGMVPK